MKNAGKLLTENKQEAFYDEVLKALWGYISDKLNIPVSQLSKDNIEDELTQYGVAPELIKDFIGTLNECEFAVMLRVTKMKLWIKYILRLLRSSAKWRVV